MLIRSEPVRSVMTSDVRTVDVDACLSDVRDLLREHAFHHVPVVRDGVLVGMLSASDVARVSLEAWGVDELTTDATLDASFSLSAVMSHDVTSVLANDSIYRATEILAAGEFHALPVVDAERRVVGIVTSTDLLRFLYRSF